MSVLFAGNLSPFSSVVTLFNMPYLFPNIEDAFALFNDKAFMKKISDIVAKQSGVRPLGWAISSYRHITNSKHPIKNINDLQGLKIRVSPAEAQLQSFRAWGVDPHPLAWTETFNALQQGVVDGQENPYATNADQKFWEIQKYTTELHYMLWIGPILVSEAWYQKQDDATKAIIDKAGEITAQFGTELLQDIAEKAKQDCIDHGMIIDTLQDEEVWAEKARAIWPRFYETIGSKELVDEAVAIIEKARQK
jgi:TRAP-type C4-dicarboxylate transport system substrate-binding protein